MYFRKPLWVLRRGCHFFWSSEEPPYFENFSRSKHSRPQNSKRLYSVMSSLSAPSASAPSSPFTQEINLISSEDEDTFVPTETAIPNKKPRGRPRKDRQQERLQGPLAPVPVEKKTTLSAKLKQSLEEMKEKAAELETKQTTLQKTLDDALEAIKCMVCYNTMFRPTTLSCGHSACVLCLTLNEEISHKAECPVCRAVQHDDYKINITMQNIIQVLCRNMSCYGPRYTQ